MKNQNQIGKETWLYFIISALKDEKYGIFLLNGKGLQEDSQKFVAKGARFHYVKRSTSETLETVGPLNAFLVVMVNVTKHILFILYTYLI